MQIGAGHIVCGQRQFPVYIVTGEPCRRRLEVQLQSDLVPARIGHQSSRLAKIRVGPVAGVITAPIVMVGSVEDIERYTERRLRTPEIREVLAKPDVYIAIRERTRDCEAAELELVACSSESAETRRTAHILTILATKCGEPGELYSKQVRKVSNPVRYEPLLL